MICSELFKNYIVNIHIIFITIWLQHRKNGNKSFTSMSFKQLGSVASIAYTGYKLTTMTSDWISTVHPPGSPIHMSICPPHILGVIVGGFFTLCVIDSILDLVKPPETMFL